jgi:microcystin-dependent protein
MAYQFIDATECLGDSLFKINNNAASFDTRIDQLNTLISALTGALNTAISQAVPAGAVHSFVQSSPPTGWISCEGVIVPDGVGTVTTSFGNITANFAALHAAVSTKFGSAGQLPDLRGYFIRGHGTNSDSTASIGSLGRKQTDAFKSHNHTVSSNGTRTGANTANPGANFFASSGDVGNFGAKSMTSTSVGDTETRPKNISLLYCIKY